jgi:hypothetical protein
MASSRGEAQAVRIEQAVSAFVDRIRGVSPGLLTRAPAPGEWDLMQLAAHCAEIYGYWAKQVAELRLNPAQPFGRTAADPQRAQFIEDHRGDPLEGLIARMQDGAAEAAMVLCAFDDDEWITVTGLHSGRGLMDMDSICRLFLTGHAEEHLNQFDQTLEQLTRERRDEGSKPSFD